MSLRYAVLGLLSNGPASGYDLAKAFDTEFGRYAWYASHTQIYPELAKLAGEGLIAVDEEGSRRRRSYKLTDVGWDELRTWVKGPPIWTRARNEAVLRAFLLPILGVDDLRTEMQEFIDRSESEIQRLREIVAGLDAESSTTDSPQLDRMAGEYGIRLNLAVQEWAQWVLDNQA